MSFRVLFHSLATFFVASPIAYAIPIFSTGAADATNVNNGSVSDTGSIIAADDFSYSGSNYVINEVRWWGAFASYDDSSAPTTDFRMAIFANAGGEPATSPIYDITVAPTVNAPLGQIGGSGPQLFRFEATFANLALIDGETYWISIRERHPSESFSWIEPALATTGNAHTADLSVIGTTEDPLSGLSWIDAAGEMGEGQPQLAFSLFGDEVSGPVVPEPTSLALLGMGTLGFMGYGWRRRKREGESIEV